MAERIIVTVKGPLGLDDADSLLAELERETGLDWHEEDRPDDKNLSGVLELILVAIISKSVGTAFDQALAKAREVIERWRKTRLDPPDASIDTAPADGSGESGPLADPEPES
jgi:hypothetical protein